MDNKYSVMWSSVKTKWKLRVLCAALGVSSLSAQTWKKANGIENFWVNAIEHYDGDTLLAGLSQEQGLYASFDKGRNWKPLFFEGNNILSLLKKDDFILVGNQYNEPIKFDIPYRGWKQVNLTGADDNNFFTLNDYIFVCRSGSYSYSENEGIWMSEDDGENWGRFGPHIFPEGFSGMHWDEQGRLYGVGKKGAYYYQDGAWIRTTGNEDRPVNTVHCLEDGTVLYGADLGVFVSKDRGKSMSTYIHFPAGAGVKFFRVGDLFYCASSEGIHRFHYSNVLGQWENLNFDKSAVHLKVIDNTIYVGTPHGIYYAENISTNVEKAEPLSVKVYPNPTMDQVYFQVPDESELTVQVLDQEGRIVKTGTSSTMDLSSLANGIYLYRLIIQEKVHCGRLQKM